MSKKSIIIHKNTGLGDCLLQTANAWLYAKKTNRKLIIAWSDSSYFAERGRLSFIRQFFNFSKDLRLNAFTYFFSIPENIGGVEVINKKQISIGLVMRIRFFKLKTILLDKFLPKLSSKIKEDDMDIIGEGKEVTTSSLLYMWCFEPDKKEAKLFFDMFTTSSYLCKENSILSG